MCGSWCTGRGVLQESLGDGGIVVLREVACLVQVVHLGQDLGEEEADRVQASIAAGRSHGSRICHRVGVGVCA